MGGKYIPFCSGLQWPRLVASRCRLDVLYFSSMRTLAIGADGLPSPRKEGLTTLKLKVVVLCAVVAVTTAIADGSRPRLFLRPHLLPGLRERCANGDLAGRYAGWRRDARRAIGADMPPEPPVLPKQQPDRNREYARVFRTVRPPPSRPAQTRRKARACAWTAAADVATSCSRAAKHRCQQWCSSSSCVLCGKNQQGRLG